MSASLLPPELWCMVADLLPIAFDSKEDIVSLSSTSSQLRSVCLPYIFKNIRVRFCFTAEQYQEARAWDESEHLGQYSGSRTEPPTLPKLLELLRSNPSLAASVSVLAMEPVDTLRQLRSLGTTLLHPVPLFNILHLLPKLHNLRLRSTGLLGTAEEVTEMLQATELGGLSVQRLELCGMYHGTGKWGAVSLSTLLLFDTIEELRLSDFDCSLEHELPLFQLSQSTSIQAIAIDGTVPITRLLETISGPLSRVHHCLTSLDVEDVFHFFWLGSEIDALHKLLSGIGRQIVHLGFGLWSCVVPLFPHRRFFDPDLRDEIFLHCPNLQSLRLHIYLFNTPSAIDVIGLLSETLHGIRTTSCLPHLTRLRLSFLPVNMGFHLVSPTDSLENVRRSHPDRFRAVEDELLAMQDVEIMIDVTENHDVKVSTEAIREQYLAPLFSRIWGKLKPAPIDPWPQT